MLMEIKYGTYVSGNQETCSVQGQDVRGVLVYLGREDASDLTFLTVRTPQTTLCERISLKKLHRISDFVGGNAPDGGVATGVFVYVNLGLVSLDDSEELYIQLDTTATPGAATTYGVAVVVADLPEHDEVAYHYKYFTDSSFAVDACTSLFVFSSYPINTLGDLINLKVGEDTRSVTLRAANWWANVSGRVELDVTDFGVVLDNPYGQSVVVNHGISGGGVVFVARRVIQSDPVRRAAVTERLVKRAARKVRQIDVQSLKAST